MMLSKRREEMQPAASQGDIWLAGQQAWCATACRLQPRPAAAAAATRAATFSACFTASASPAVDALVMLDIQVSDEDDGIACPLGA